MLMRAFDAARGWFRELVVVTFALALPMAANATGGAIRFDRSEIEAWAADNFESALRNHEFSAAGVVVVQDGQVLLQRGYGMEDWASRTPVDPERTLFRVESVSKTFAGLAIAQLLETGRIHSIDDPANQYLKRFQLPGERGARVSIRHLLTHMGGFDDSYFAHESSRPSDVPATAAEIAPLIPRIVREPGIDSVYSNFGTATLGAIVEDVSESSYPDYLREHIYRPLGMEASDVVYAGHRPVRLLKPANIGPDGSPEPYVVHEPQPFFVPPSGVAVSLADMGRYISALLDAGKGSSSDVLSTHGFERLFAALTTRPVGFQGFAMQWMVIDWNGEPVLLHPGSNTGVDSMVVLFPASNIGVFMQITPPKQGNLGGLIGLFHALTGRGKGSHGADTTPPGAASPVGRFPSQQELRKFFPALSTYGALFKLVAPRIGIPAVSDHGAKLPDSSIVKTWVSARHSHDSMLKINQIYGVVYATVRIDKAGEGFAVNLQPGFQQSDGAVLSAAPLEAMALRSTADRRWLIRQYGTDMYEAVSVFQNPLLLLFSALLALALLATNVASLAWPRLDERGVPLPRVAPWWPLLCGLSFVGIVLVLHLGYAPLDDFGNVVAEGRIPRLAAAATLGTLSAIFAVIGAAIAVQSWRTNAWGPGVRGLARRIHYTILCCAGLALGWFLWVFNLIGWHSP